MNDDLYKEDRFFVELLNSGDRKRQCEYRNAVIKAIVRLEKADKDNRISEEIWSKIYEQDVTVRALTKVHRLFKIFNVVMLIDVLAFICLRAYLFYGYSHGTLSATEVELFAVYCGEGSNGRLIFRSVALALVGVYNLMSRSLLTNAKNKTDYDFIVQVPMEPDFSEEITDSLDGNTLRTLIAKRDALDGVLWGG